MVLFWYLKDFLAYGLHSFERFPGSCILNIIPFQVDEYSQTSVDSIWAVGDVTDRVNLTPVALMEGGAFARTVFNSEPTKPDYR